MVETIRETPLCARHPEKGLRPPLLGDDTGPLDARLETCACRVGDCRCTADFQSLSASKRRGVYGMPVEHSCRILDEVILTK